MKRAPFDPAQLTVRPYSVDVTKAGDRPSFSARVPISEIPRDAEALLRAELVALHARGTVLTLSREGFVNFTTTEAELPSHLRTIDDTLSRVEAQYIALCARNEAGSSAAEKYKQASEAALERIAKELSGY